MHQFLNQQNIRMRWICETCRSSMSQIIQAYALQRPRSLEKQYNYFLMPQLLS